MITEKTKKEKMTTTKTKIEKEEAKELTITERLIIAQGLATNVDTRGTASAGSSTYSYAKSEDVIIIAKSALQQAGLALVPTAAEIEYVDGVVTDIKTTTEKNRDGSTYEKNKITHSRPRAILNRIIKIFDGTKDGEILITCTPWPIEEQAGRPWDKAIAVASTTQLAYTLRDVLLMPRCHDDDMDFQKAEPQKKPAMQLSDEEKIAREKSISIMRLAVNNVNAYAADGLIESDDCKKSIEDVCTELHTFGQKGSDAVGLLTGWIAEKTSGAEGLCTLKMKMIIKEA